jgi:hypothetical protein
MTPKEKSINLFNNYVKLLPFGSNVERAKECALIAVDEILKAVEGKYDEYWLEVKNEIEKL